MPQCPTGVIEPITRDELDWLCKTALLIRRNETGEIPIFMACLICILAADFHGVPLFDWQNKSERKLLVDNLLNDKRLCVVELKH